MMICTATRITIYCTSFSVVLSSTICAFRNCFVGTKKWRTFFALNRLIQQQICLSPQSKESILY
uniref:Uncharacterized protein n=1 Tax=Anguilla anguilla TaxID=7936 RepID=A0A0E9SLC8_ANGAN